MLTIKKILVPTDLSAISVPAIGYAGCLAKDHDVVNNDAGSLVAVSNFNLSCGLRKSLFSSQFSIFSTEKRGYPVETARNSVENFPISIEKDKRLEVKLIDQWAA